MLVFSILEEVLKLKGVIGGSGHGILPWFGGYIAHEGGGGAEKNINFRTSSCGGGEASKL